MKILNYSKLHNQRKMFINKNQNLDHVIIKGLNNVLLSAPHGVNQVRLGKLKFKEIGSLTTALYLQKETDSFMIAKTKNNNDDANFDEVSRYKQAIIKIIKKNNIKYLFDIHGLAVRHYIDVNLGTHLGNNITANPNLLSKFQNRLIKAGFKVSIDQPFMAGTHTICSSMKREFEDLFALQIEIRCDITNNPNNIEKYSKLLDVLIDCIKNV